MNSADHFEAIVSEHCEPLFRFALSLSRMESDALDLTQHIARGIAQLRESLLSDEARASTPLSTDRQNGALVPVPRWNQAARLDSHWCHSHV